jgi:thymidylate kinase
MAFIAFLGCDGSGKSSVIEGVAAEMARRGVVVIRGHWRPAPFDSARAGAGSADDPHGKPPRGAVASVMKLGWLAVSWWSGWFRGLRQQAARGLVIFDRYHADLMVDPKRYRYGGPMALARLASAWMPQPDIIFFLDADPEVLLARKQEVSLESLAASRRTYLSLASWNPRLRVIDAARTLDLVIFDVIHQIEQANGNHENVPERQ